MIKKVKVNNEDLQDILLFDEILDVKKINILFGGNGVGKSTFLKAIRDKTLDVENNVEYDVITYINSVNNSRAAKETNSAHSKKLFYGNGSTQDYIDIYNATGMSEGQSIIFYMLKFLEEVKESAKLANESGKDLVVAIDELDSGLSVENINFLLHLICDITKEFDNVQFFISSNNYHFVYIFKTVLNMYTGKYEDIEDYESYFQKLNTGIALLHGSGKRNFNFLRQ